MVHALHEARRVLKAGGVLLDVRPVTAPLVVEVIVATQAVWGESISAFSAPDDIAAADAAMEHALASEWFALEKSVPYHLEIYCDTAGELRAYVEDRKIIGGEIPYDELEERRQALATPDEAARLRCRRPWMLSKYLTAS